MNVKTGSQSRRSVKFSQNKTKQKKAKLITEEEFLVVMATGDVLMKLFLFFSRYDMKVELI